MDNYVYILKCRDNTLYTGWTNNLEKRINSHRQGKGAKYTRGRGPLTLVYIENFDNKIDAMKREAEIKSFRLEKKKLLIGKKMSLEKIKIIEETNKFL